MFFRCSIIPFVNLVAFIICYLMFCGSLVMFFLRFNWYAFSFSVFLTFGCSAFSCSAFPCLCFSVFLPLCVSVFFCSSVPTDPRRLPAAPPLSALLCFSAFQFPPFKPPPRPTAGPPPTPPCFCMFSCFSVRPNAACTPPPLRPISPPPLPPVFVFL